MSRGRDGEAGAGAGAAGEWKEETHQGGRFPDTFKLYTSPTYTQKQGEGVIMEPGGYKVHLAVKDEQLNLQQAVKILKVVADNHPRLPVEFKALNPEIKDRKEKVREGAEITIYIPGDKSFETEAAAADAWVSFFEAVDEAFTLDKVRGSIQTETDKSINNFASYRMGPNGRNGGEEIGKFYDLAGKAFKGRDGVALELSYNDALFAKGSVPSKKQMYNPLELPDQLGEAIKRGDAVRLSSGSSLGSPPPGMTRGFQAFLVRAGGIGPGAGGAAAADGPAVQRTGSGPKSWQKTEDEKREINEGQSRGRGGGPTENGG